MSRKHRSDEQKEKSSYILCYYNTEIKKPFILLNSETFTFLKPEDTIEISFISKKNVKIMFKLSKENFSNNYEKGISINGSAVDLITKSYNFNPIKEKIYIHKLNPETENIALSEIILELSEYVPRSELFNITLNMLNDTVIKGQEIYNKDKKIIGVISKLSNDSFSGLVTSSTNFNLTSLNSDIYLMFDISKTSYYYTSYFYVNYEIICDYVKNLLLKLQTENTHHNIHIIFYIRIFFKSKNDYTKYDFIIKDSSENDEDKYYFDLYDKIETFNMENLVINEIIYKMKKIYQIYSKIQSFAQQKKYFSNLNQFLFSIRENLQYPISILEKQILFLNKDILSYSFKGYEFSDEHKENECSALDNDIFKDVEMFEISGFNEIAIFQALFFDIGLIEKNKKNKNKKYNPLINIVLSGVSFPYYCNALSDKVKSSINEEYIHLIFTFLCQKNCVSGRKNPEYYFEIDKKEIKENKEYHKLDNKFCEIPPWCKIYYVTHSSLYQNLQKYKIKYKKASNDKNISNIYKINSLVDYDENFKLNILNLNLESNEGENNFIKDEENPTKPRNNVELNLRKSKKKLTLEDILQKYSTKKISPHKNKENQLRTPSNEEMDYPKNYLIDFKSISSNSKHDIGDEFLSEIPQENNEKKGFENKNSEEGINALENLFTHVPVPFFLEFAKNMRIDPGIQKCYSTKKNKNLILKRIDKNFNLIIENERDETLNLIKNIINNPNNDFKEKFLMTNRKLLNIIEYKTYTTDVLQYNFKRKGLFFSYYYIVSNSINGSVFIKTNKQVKKQDLQEMDNNLSD